MNLSDLIDHAKQIVFASQKRFPRKNFLFAAVGVRADGAIVHSTNGNQAKPTLDGHAEYRLSKKLTPSSTVVVVRLLKNGELGTARPCDGCIRSMKARGVLRVFYSTYDGIECMDLEKGDGK